MYVEAILIAQHVWQVPTRLRCSLISPGLRASAERLGLHAKP